MSKSFIAIMVAVALVAIITIGFATQGFAHPQPETVCVADPDMNISMQFPSYTFSCVNITVNEPCSINNGSCDIYYPCDWVGVTVGLTRKGGASPCANCNVYCIDESGTWVLPYTVHIQNVAPEHFQIECSFYNGIGDYYTIYLVGENGQQGDCQFWDEEEDVHFAFFCNQCRPIE